MQVPVGILLFVSVLFVGCNEKSEKKAETSLKKPLTIKKNLSKHISGLTWYLNMEDGLKQAKIENKRILIMVGEDSCRWCKKMKEETLIDVRIQNKLKQYILVSIKRSNSKQIGYLDTFDGNIPSFFLMQKNKELSESIVGYYKSDDFLDYLNEIEE
jgi:thioredoxin-related protein